MGRLPKPRRWPQHRPQLAEARRRPVAAGPAGRHGVATVLVSPRYRAQTDSQGHHTRGGNDER